MKILAQVALGILLAQSAQAGQQIDGRFYPEKKTFLVGEPIFVVLDLTNVGPESARMVDDGSCWISTRFEAPATSQPHEVSLYGCSGGGIAGDCLGSFVELLPGEHFKKRFLLDGPFRLNHPQVYPIRGHHTVQVYSTEESSNASTMKEIVSDFEVSLMHGDQSELVSAYQPILRGLKSPDPSSRGLAISAVTQDPPRFLEKVILALADDSQTAGASIAGLKRLATPQAKAKLAQLAGVANPEWIRQQAITALGELGDPSYCSLLLEIARSSAEYSSFSALRAAGFTCEKQALPTLLGLLPNANSTLRYELAYALGNTHTREAVSPLISLLADTDENVRRAAAEALATLTHRTPTEDIRNQGSATQAYSDWVRWWSLNKGTAPIYSVRQCNGSAPLD